MNDSLFTGQLDLRYLGKRRLWMTLEPFSFNDPKLGERMAPPSFTSDLASILALRNAAHYLFLLMAGFYLARGLWPQSEALAQWVGSLGLACALIYSAMAGYFVRAGLLHDWEYKLGQLSKWQCDLLFYRAGRAEGHAIWRCAAAWLGVAIGGWPAWLRHRRAQRA